MDRDDKDYAIEFGKYLADTTESFTDLFCKIRFLTDNPDDLTDGLTAVRSAIHEFRTRANKCKRG